MLPHRTTFSDMRKKGNPGFAFLNFREYITVVDFVAEFSGRRWNLDRKKVRRANAPFATPAHPAAHYPHAPTFLVRRPSRRPT